MSGSRKTRQKLEKRDGIAKVLPLIGEFTTTIGNCRVHKAQIHDLDRLQAVLTACSHLDL